jgi:hypothetical protein
MTLKCKWAVIQVKNLKVMLKASGKVLSQPEDPNRAAVVVAIEIGDRSNERAKMLFAGYQLLF